MRTQPILSRRDPDDPHPWAEIDVEDGNLAINVRALNGAAPSRAGQEARAGRTRPEAARRGIEQAEERARGPRGLALTQGTRPDDAPDLDERPTLADEIHVLAETLDGDLEFVPESQQRETYYAHLGWYDPATGEWTLLEFVDPADV